MATIQATPQVTNAAIRATYELQYNSNKAAQFVCTEVPGTTYEQAIAVINQVVRPSKKK